MFGEIKQWCFIKSLAAMDNRQVEINSEGREDFELAMKLAFSKYNKAIAYQVKENTLVFYWAEYDLASPFPFEMNVNDAINFAWSWLENTKPLEKEPGHDGDNGRGFRVYNDNWGHVFNSWQAIIGIQPIWAMYGK